MVQTFVAWLEEQGWTVRVEQDHCDVVAERGPERLFAEAKGDTSERGTDLDINYGQLLRRMDPTADEQTRYGIVVRPSCRTAALRVREHVRAALRIDIYVVDADGKVEVIAPAAV